MLINLLSRFKRQYTHINSKGEKYWLYKTDVTLRGGNPHTIYFFGRTADKHKTMTQAQSGRKSIEVAKLPRDRIVRENPRNGFLTISRRRS